MSVEANRQLDRPRPAIAEIDAVELAEDTELLATVRQAYEDNEPLPLR
jgi:hypothetical protein